LTTHPASAGSPARPAGRRRFLRLAAYLAVLFLFLEGTARFVVASDQLFPRIFSPLDEPSWRLRWLRSRGADGAVTRLSFDRHHPVRGWTLAPNLRDLPVFAGKKLSSNSRGLRGAREVSGAKAPGFLRIALFGDSFTFGEDVGDEETFGWQLEQLLVRTGTPAEVLNFGIHGYGHDQMLLYLREALPLYRPDVVLFGYVTDDSLRNLTRFRDFAKPRFRLAHGRLELEGVPVPAPETVAAREAWRSRLFDLLKMAGTRLAFIFGGRLAEVDRLTDALLTEMIREARAAGARPAIVFLPSFGELGAPDPAPLPAEAFVAALAERERVPFLRLRPLFLERARLGAELSRVGHWAPLEHRLAAGGIADFLRREGLAP
jgi:lysophospholipase L1-like esterase